MSAIYLDATPFCYAALYEGERADGAAALLREIVDGERAGLTSTHAIAEGLSRLERTADGGFARTQFARVLDFPNLTVAPVEARHTVRAIRVGDRHPQLSAANALHVAVMAERGVSAIASASEALEDVPDVDRHPLADFSE